VAVNQNSGANRGVGMVREVIGGAEEGQSAVAEEFVDVPTGVDNGRPLCIACPPSTTMKTNDSA
jgi:hypothetical protein